MRFRFLVILLLTQILLSSCTIFFPLRKVEVLEDKYPADSMMVEPYRSYATPTEPSSYADFGPTHFAQQEQQEFLSVSDYSPEIGFVVLDEPETPRPEIYFSESQTAHVRSSQTAYAPFPSSGELVIPIKELERDFCYPYPGQMISPFGPRGRSMHTGMDIKAIPNDTIRAAFSGVVRMAKYYSGYGNIIVIYHYTGIETVYSHESKLLVSPNDVVKAGDPIGLAGRTGRATTEHLHFEVRVGGEPLNPTLILDPDNYRLKTDQTLYLYSVNGIIKGYNTPLSSDALVQMTQPSAPVTAAATNSASTATPPSATYHTIKSGDTLYALALKHSTTVRKICQLNGISENKVLRIGEKLRIK